MCIFYPVAALLLSLRGSVQGTAANNTLYLAYTLPWTKGWLLGPDIGAAIVIGIDEVYKRRILPDFEIEWTFRDSFCNPKQGMQMTVDMWDSAEDVHAIIGDGCSTVCQPVSLLAAAWGIPVVSWGCASPSLSNKAEYPTFTRVTGPFTYNAPVYSSLAALMKWTRIGIITTPEDIWKLTAEAIKTHLESSGVQVFFQVVKPSFQGISIVDEHFLSLRGVISNMKDNVRVFAILGYTAERRNMLIASMDEGLLNGDYAFIIISVNNHLIAATPTFRPEADQSIMTGLIGIEIKEPSGSEYEAFLGDVVEAFQHPIFEDLPHVTPDDNITDMTFYTGFVHDAVLQWAYGVNKTLEQGYPPDDGFQITKNIFNMSFEGISGKVTINDVGDRLLDQRIVIVQNGQMVPLLEWNAAEGILRKVYKPQDPHDWSGIYWHGNGTVVPMDPPNCGRDEEKCAQDTDNSLIVNVVVSVLSVLLFVFVVGSICAIKRYKYEQDLKGFGSALIPWSDIDISGQDKGDVNASQSEMSDRKTVLYKGEIVFIKRLGGSTIDLQNRKVLVDLKEMRDLTHENINSFVGICTDVPNACIIMAFETRGSLQSLIREGNVKLDWDFKSSLLWDIGHGMWYIQNSTLGYHGSLTSAQCVVDSRWTCKITGHGLRHIRPTVSIQDLQSNKPEKLLWTAPERLRDTDMPGTIKADVYSFGIILQELILESVPFGEENEASAIITRVKNTETPPFRPVVNNTSCSKIGMDLMKSCWDEKSENRPSFEKIMSLLRKINKGKSFDLIETMIRRLEVYTSNLEEMVADRTINLVVEKEKVETLLSELLPKSVADRLQSGTPVDPEAFDSVTVFFSDIVGFTGISSTASPMEIVVLLNNMYTLFDDVARGYDAYKVATIGDAYMVASGVPIRNQTKHACAICSLAIALLDSIQDFAIPHMPGVLLQLRIGIYSGSCVAGVAGVKMPRYLLFGDTVNIAAKMESSGEAMKIQIGDTTKELLSDTQGFIIEKRGTIDIKEKGSIKTFWLSKMLKE